MDNLYKKFLTLFFDHPFGAVLDLVKILILKIFATNIAYQFPWNVKIKLFLLNKIVFINKQMQIKYLVYMWLLLNFLVGIEIIFILLSNFFFISLFTVIIETFLIFVTKKLDNINKFFSTPPTFKWGINRINFFLVNDT